MLRTMSLAVAVVLAAGAAGRADEAEDKAVTLVTGLGGYVERDEKAPGKPVVTVSLFEKKVTDAGLRELAALKNITSLNVGRTKVTDVGVKDLIAFKNLTSLYLGRTQVTDAGLKELQKALPKCNISK